MRAMPRGKVIDEDIQGGDRVTLLRLPMGLLGLAICLDFCEGGDSPVTDLWRSIGPALLLVPSMGEKSTNRAHARKAKDLSRHHGTVTVVASQHPEEVEALGLLWSGDGRSVEKAPILYETVVWTAG